MIYRTYRDKHLCCAHRVTTDFSLGRFQVRDVWLSKDAGGSTVLMAAVKSCSQDVLETVLELMMEDLFDDQVRYTCLCDPFSNAVGCRSQ